MKAIEIVRQAQDSLFIDKNGKQTRLRLDPPLKQEELTKLEKDLPCPLPLEVRELLQYSRGFSTEFAGDLLEMVDFSSSSFSCGGMEDISPHGMPIANDECGNHWIVDLWPDSTGFEPIFYLCHDPPVMILQSESLSHFIQELFKLGNKPWESEISQVHERYAMDVWRENPGVMTYDQCLANGDSDLRTFANSLDGSFLITDLRQSTVGAGFSWGRFGAETVCKRFGSKRIFAVQQKKLTWIQKIFGV